MKSVRFNHFIFGCVTTGDVFYNACMFVGHGSCNLLLMNSRNCNSAYILCRCLNCRVPTLTGPHVLSGKQPLSSTRYSVCLVKANNLLPYACTCMLLYVTVHSHVIGARLLIGVHEIYGPITIITILQLFSSLAHDPPRCHH